jgi:Site-specific DNA methylase
MAHLGDITKVDGGKIPPVHVITFGSPCQNLSLIGNRSGLAGAKSSLFYQAFRIIQEMRDATDNLYPAIAVWENVMGAFSTNDRMDFRAVLIRLLGHRSSNASFGKMGKRRNGARGNA